ncbi:hypothetical protein IU450_36215 [Nocardia abscessus]|uniref:hypothetical protein n=1 Tax=Nocardia abscessus TaxID=120957 RepID=UPI001895B811|nr:hypothetical protein [Nocardia abscessus]MBF6341288.1 hypothetical protein [Nocardia abscessus]
MNEALRQLANQILPKLVEVHAEVERWQGENKTTCHYAVVQIRRELRQAVHEFEHMARGEHTPAYLTALEQFRSQMGSDA